MKQSASSSQVLQQFTFELESWQRSLAFQLEELVYFKNRLPEIIPSIEDGENLLVVENFQEQFLTQEKIIAYLTTELKAQTRLFEKDLYFDGEILLSVVKSQKELRKEMGKAEEYFTGVKNRFVQFLIDRY